MVLKPRTRTGMPLDEFITEFERAPFELIDGEKRALVPPVAIHIYIIKRLLAALLVYEMGHETTGQFFVESTFVMMDVKKWVKDSRVPDIAFYAASRWEEYLASTPDWQGKPFVLVPDLCVEVISHTDLYRDVQRKVDLYLEDGVRQVWVISPEDRTLFIYTAGDKAIARLTADDLLTSLLLPDFSLPVASLFPA